MVSWKIAQSGKGDRRTQAISLFKCNRLEILKTSIPPLILET